MDHATFDANPTIQPDRWGVALQPDGRTRFRVWGPSVDKLELELQGQPKQAMEAHEESWWEINAAAPAGTRYRFVLPDGLAVPDPASRRQDGGVHGWSVVPAPDDFAWINTGWQTPPWHETVIYEAHAGLMGGFEGLRRRLPGLRDLGINTLELMPVNEFPGERNWGYDGTLPYAADSSYGTTDQLKQLIDEAHGLGLSVMLDVVYNHFGPDGSYISTYCKPFFTEDMHTPWGAAIDFRKPDVLDFYVGNALYWLREFRFDGLRFDALHAIMPQDALLPLEHAIRAGMGERPVHLVMEHEDNAAQFLRPKPGAPGFDAQWADDFHHCLHVLLTGETASYYVDYDHPTERLARILTEGFAYQGEISRLRGRPRGEPSGHLPTSCFVVHLQNHDQIGNRARGERLPVLTSPEKLRAATALLLLSPFIPLVFMGDEWATRSPFLFFTDHHEELAELVRKGRAKEFGIGVASDPAEAGEKDELPDPNAPSTYEACHVEESDPSMRALYQALLRLRREHVAPGIPGARALGCDVLGEGAVAARWRMGTGATLSIVLNLGADVKASTPPGTLLHESASGASDRLQAGILLGGSMIAYLEPEH